MIKICLAGLTFVVSVTTAQAGDIVYQPRNPSFGGNPFYSDHLLGTAQAQDKHKDPSLKSLDLGRSDLSSPGQEFERIIQSSLMSRISSEIANQILGNDAGSGRFVIGDTQVDFSNSGGQTEVFITDIVSGGRTRIELPTPTAATRF